MSRFYGYHGVYRKLLEDATWLTGTPTQKILMLVCILRANYEPTDWVFKGEKMSVKKGQFVTSLDDLQKNAGKGVTIQNIRTALKNLEKYRFLTNESTKTGRLITVLNYCKYHDMMLKTNIESNSLLTINQQRPNKDLTPDNKDNNNIIKIKKKKYFSEDSIEYRLAVHLLKEIRKNNPGYKEPSLQDWAKGIDQMIRLDKRTPEQIGEVIEWCQQDDFWLSNILSTSKLREKFDQLVVKMNSSSTRGSSDSVAETSAKRCYAGCHGVCGASRANPERESCKWCFDNLRG